MKTKLIAGVCLILCLPVFVVGTYLFSSFLPREYFSHVRIEVQHSGDRIQVVTLSDENFDTPFPVTELRILQSKEIIYPVIDELHLIDKWTTDGQKFSKEQVYFKILKMLVLKEIRGTNLIDIGVWSHDPQEAANIANTIALFTPVKILEKAEPAIVPARPNVPLIMFIGSGIGFLLANIGGVFVLLGLRAQKA